MVCQDGFKSIVSLRYMMANKKLVATESCCHFAAFVTCVLCDFLPSILHCKVRRLSGCADASFVCFVQIMGRRIIVMQPWSMETALYLTKLLMSCKRALWMLYRVWVKSRNAVTTINTNLTVIAAVVAGLEENAVTYSWQVSLLAAEVFEIYYDIFLSFIFSFASRMSECFHMLLVSWWCWLFWIFVTSVIFVTIAPATFLTVGATTYCFKTRIIYRVLVLKYFF